MNGGFFHRETWKLLGTVNDHRGVPIPLTGATVTVKIYDNDLNTGEELWAITKTAIPDADAGVGAWECAISPAEQDDVVPGTVKYAVRAVFADGTASIQNTGTIKVQPDPFVA